MMDSRQTRAAYEAARALLAMLRQDPVLLQVLIESADGKQVIEQIERDVAILKAAPKLRIGAARRLQGVASRKRTWSQLLFDACAKVRRRIKLRYRGPRHAALRRAFAEGYSASPAKPETVLAFADKIVAAAAVSPEELREVRIGPPSIKRIADLRADLRNCRPERAELCTTRKQVWEELSKVAERVRDRCQSLAELAHRLYPQVDLGELLATKGHPGRRAAPGVSVGQRRGP